MINKLRSKLSWKIFLLIFTLSMLSSLFTIVCISVFVPAQFFEYAIGFNDAVADLEDRLNNTQSASEREKIIHQFSADSGYSYSYQTRSEQDEIETDSLNAEETEWTLEKPDSESVTFVIDQEATTTEVTVFKNTTLIERVFSTFLNSLIPIVLWVFVLSLILSWLYTRYISRPIIALDRISIRMMDMQYNSIPGKYSKDEIGELSCNIHRLYGQLTSTIEQLKEKNEQMKDLFQATSHDLKTPLTVMKGSLQVMLEQPDLTTSETLYLENSLNACNRMEKMVESILSLTKLEKENKFSFQRVRVDELIRREIIELLPAIEQKNQVLKADLDLPVEMELDPVLFGNALRNLLLNAIKYSGNGESIRVHLYQAEDPVLSIENTGVHLTQEDLKKIFDPFFRADRSRNSKTDGNGLGLTITKRILQAHGFSIQAKNSEEGFLVFVCFTKNSQKPYKANISP